MKKLNLKRLGVDLLLCGVLGLICDVLINESSMLYRIINGLFVGGMGVFLIGLFRYVRRMGFFDLLIYSHKKMGQYSKRHKDEPDRQNQKLGSYHDYMMKKEKNSDCREPLLVGGFFTFAAIILSLVDLFLLN